MSTLRDIDKIENIVEMANTMVSLKIPAEGLKTLDEMKAKVKETLQSSEKKSSWTAKEAFSVLTEAKKEDERKRATLLGYYERTDDCLQSMDGKVHALLEQNIKNLMEKIASHKRNLLKKEYIVLVAGEASSGKSTLLNLILGEQLLPYSVLSTTSTICELRYGDTPELVVHFKDKGSGDTSRTVHLEKPTEASEQSYLEQISQFVHRKTNREKGSDYEKIELFWPHDLLKENIVIVDSPGIGESPIMDDIVKEYLPEAFAFIYVINSDNAGGIQPDRLGKLIEHARRVSLDEQRESSSNCALFVCNKWDHMPSKETEDVKNHIVTKLKECWPFLDPESQIIYMSAKEASEAQKLGVVTEEFAELMNGIKSMVLKSIEARLQIQWRWLDYLLARMALHTTAFVRNSSEDRKKVIDRMKFVTDRLQSIEREQDTVGKQLQLHLKKITDEAVSTLSTYLKSSEVMQQFSSWTLDEVPKTKESWEITQNYIQNALRRRLREKIKECEEKNHVFSDARASLIQKFQERFRYVEGQLRTLEGSVLAGGVTRSTSGPSVSNDFSVAQKVIIGVTSPLWFPIGLVVLVVGVPILGAIAVKGKLENWNKTRQYNNDKCAFMSKASQEYLNEVVQEQHLRPFVMEQLKEARVCLKQVLDRIPQLIEEDKMLCQQLSNENRSKKEVEDFYTPLLEKSVQIRDGMALFGIKEVRTMDISCDDLEWQDDAPLGSGAFASVYRGKRRIRGENKPVDVAVKVWNEELDEVTAGGFISETEILSYITLVGKVTPCGRSPDYPGQVECITLEDCTKDVTGHLSTLGLSADEGSRTEMKLLLARAGVFSFEQKHLTLTICPRHRADFGIRWRTRKTLCAIPKDLAIHKSSSAKGSNRVDSRKSMYIFCNTNTLVSVGSPICRRCDEFTCRQVADEQTPAEGAGASTVSTPKEPRVVQIPEQQTMVHEMETDRPGEESSAGSESSSDGLETDLMFLEISSQGLKDDETFLSPDTASLVSSTSEESITSKPNSREKLNEYLVSKNIEPVSQPWVEWEKASDSTKLRYTRRTAEIFSSVLHDLTPSCAGCNL